MFHGKWRYGLIVLAALTFQAATPERSEAQCLDRLRALFGCGGTSTTAYMIPTTSSMGCGPAGCAACPSQTSYYLPQTAYRPVLTLRPVTAYRPVAMYDAWTGSAVTAYRPVTSFSRTVSSIPSYRVSYSPIACDPCATRYNPCAAYCDPCGVSCDPCGGVGGASASCPTCVQMPVEEGTEREALKPTPAEEENGQAGENGGTDASNNGGQGPVFPGPEDGSSPNKVQGSGYQAPPAARPPAIQNPNDRTASRRPRTVAPVRLISAPGRSAPPPVDQIDTGGWQSWRD